MLLEVLAWTSRDVASTRSRLAKVERLAATLRALPPEEVVPGVAYLSGELRQRQIGVGWASLRDLPPPAEHPSLTVHEVDATCAAIGATSGPGSQQRRRELLSRLFEQATALEQDFLRPLLAGELRQGALEGVMADAVARAADVPAAAVRRALLLGGDLRDVAAAALGEGADGLAAFRLTVGRPLAPMLASPAESIGAALGRLGESALEEKLDGARIQVHRADGDVGVFTRSLDDITARVPEVVEAVLDLPVRQVVLDGEVLVLRADGRPQPFQVTASRVGTRVPTSRPRAAGAPTRDTLPLSPVFFDVLHVDGTDLLDAPGVERAAALAAAVPPALLIGRVVTGDVETAEAFLAETLRRGHEGVVAKSMTAPYAAGRRGGDWLKVKPRHTLDLVVLAVEWGHGRRQGWLSNLHLGARDPATGDFVMLGKTFKGMTDAMLVWQTERLLALEVSRTSATVVVRPELVVEIALDGVQRSTRYPGGVALRFARVLGYREDKTSAEADTIDAVRAIGSA